MSLLWMCADDDDDDCAWSVGLLRELENENIAAALACTAAAAARTTLLPRRTRRKQLPAENSRRMPYIIISDIT